MFNFFQATIENMDSLIHTLENLSISDDWYLGKDLYNNKEFLEKSKKRIEEVITS